MASDRRLSWTRVLGIWTLVGLALVIMMYMSLVEDVEHYGLEEHFVTFFAQMYRCWLWALLTPVVFQFRREIRRRHSSWLAVGGLNLLAAVTFFFWCNIIRIWALNITFGMWELSKYDINYVFSVLSPFTIVDFYLYWLTVGAGALYDIDVYKRQQFRKAVSLETDFAEFHFNLGNALAKTAGISESIPEYVAALKIKPDMEEARQHLGIALARTGRMDEAIAEFQEALRANPDSAEDHFNLGTALVHFGRIGEATREYELSLIHI